MTLFRAPIGGLLKGDPLKVGARSVAQVARGKAPTHLDFIRTLPCLITGKKAEAAHVSFTLKVAGKADKGVGKKADDVYVLPLSHTMHMQQHDHPKGEVGFWAARGLDRKDVVILCLRLWLASGDMQQALRVINDARSVMKETK
jgi:hypothetical protein